MQSLRRLGRFLDSFRDGPAGCVFLGEAGIGKSALWREGVARARASSCRVLTCAPAEVEARLSYASLGDLLVEVGQEVFATLPAPQRRALDVALLRTDPGGAVADQRAVGTAAVSLLGELSRLEPARRRGRRRPVARSSFGRGARVCRSEAREPSGRLPSRGFAPRPVARRRSASTARSPPSVWNGSRSGR